MNPSKVVSNKIIKKKVHKKISEIAAAINKMIFSQAS
jgi:hypothetical protein